jgi:hypothetical protein
MVGNGSDLAGFTKKWRPRPVVLANYDQRVRQSGYTPDLVLDDNNHAEHFWYIGHPSTPIGYILPSDHLVGQIAALHRESRASLFRSIFEIVPSDEIYVQHAAHTRLDGMRVLVTQVGSIALPR